MNRQRDGISEIEEKRAYARFFGFMVQPFSWSFGTFPALSRSSSSTNEEITMLRGGLLWLIGIPIPIIIILLLVL